MYTITINRDSWHYKLICQFTAEWLIRRDLCGYLQQLALAMLILFLGGVFILCITAPLTDFVIWAGVVAIYGQIVPPSYLASLGFAIFVLMIILLIAHVTTELINRREEITQAATKRLPSHTRQFLAACYESFKSRVCFKIQFKDKISD